MATTLLALRTKLNGEIGVVTDAETSPWGPVVRNAAISDGYAALYRAGVWKSVKQDYASVEGQVVYATATPRRLNRLELLDTSLNVVSRPVGFLEPDGSGTTQLTLRAPCASGYTLRAYGWTAYASSFAAAATVVSSSAAAATVITTTLAHGFTTGDTVTIAGHTGSTPAISGDYTLTVTGLTTFTIPVTVSVGGTGGTATAVSNAAVDDLEAESSRVPLLKAKAILYRQQLALFARYGERQAVAPEMNVTIDQILGIVATAEREFTDECRTLANLRTRVGQSR